MQNNQVEMRKKDKSHKIKTKTIYMRFLQSACVACRPFTKKIVCFIFFDGKHFQVENGKGQALKPNMNIETSLLRMKVTWSRDPR